MLQTYYIYEITNNVNGKTYIGQRHCPVKLTPETDVRYMGGGIYIKSAEKKYGIENFSKKILAVCYTQEILDILEMEYISMYKEIGKAEYNIAQGGEGGNLGDEVNKRISESLRSSEKYKQSLKSVERSRKLSYAASHRTKDVLYAIGSANRGKKFSEEIKLKMSIAQRNSVKKKETMHSEEYREKCRQSKLGEKNPNFRKIYTEEEKRNLSNKMKGKSHPHTEETKKKLSEMNIGKKLSQETKDRISKSLKGRTMTKEERQHHKDCWTEEKKAEISKRFKGKLKSEETKKKMSESAKKRILADKDYKIKQSNSIKNSEKYKQAMAKRKGEKLWNNGTICVRSVDCPEGFVQGRLKK